MFQRHYYYYAALGGLLAIVLIALSLISGKSRSSSVPLKVSAVVLKRAQIRTEASPTALRITPADLARGYVEVDQPSVLVLETNAPGDFRLHFALHGEQVAHAEVLGLERPLTVGPGGQVFAQPARDRSTRLSLRWRVHLRPGAAEGVHAWPVQLQLDAG